MMKFFSAVTLSWFGALAVAGCAVSTESTGAANGNATEDSDAATSREALTTGYSCGPRGCSCQGTQDCNDMFGSSVCTGRPVKCYPQGICCCFKTLTATSGSAAGLGAVGASGTVAP